MSVWAANGISNSDALPILQAVASLVNSYKYVSGMILNDEAFISAQNAGFVTDLASTPQILWSMLPRAAAYSYPAIIHDYLY